MPTRLIMMNAICNSVAPMGLNLWGIDPTQGFRSASPHCTPAYALTSPTGFLHRTQARRVHQGDVAMCLDLMHWLLDNR